MAKSSRSSRVKANKSKLANAVFRPVEDARVARLSERLLAIANSRKEPIDGPGAMEIETEKEPEKTEVLEGKEGAMEVDGEAKLTGPSKKRIAASRVRRRGRQSRHAVVFPSAQKSSAAKGGIRKGVGRRSKK